MRLFSWPPVVLLSRLPPAECHRRLNADVRSGWSFDPTQDVAGRVGARGFRLRRFFLVQANYFHAVAAGTFEAAGLGTRIRCAFRMNPLVPAFCAGAMLALLVLGARHGNADGYFLLLFLTGCALALVLYSRWLARDEPEFLTAYLRDLLEAQIVEEGAEPG